jgi:hypothetical protein
MNANEQMIREQAYDCGNMRAGRTVEATNSGSLREPNSNAGRRQERETSARMFPACGGRLIMNRALIKAKRGLTQLGGPDELACDFERRGLRDDAGAGI